MSGQGHATAVLHTGERHGTHCTGCWVGPYGRSGWARKISPLLSLNLRTIQPVASRCTDCTIPAQKSPLQC